MFGRTCCLHCHGGRIALVDREVIQGRKWVGYKECCLSEVGIGRGDRSCSEVKLRHRIMSSPFHGPAC
jgi:hypothetical protein